MLSLFEWSTCAFFLDRNIQYHLNVYFSIGPDINKTFERKDGNNFLIIGFNR